MIEYIKCITIALSLIVFCVPPYCSGSKWQTMIDGEEPVLDSHPP